MLPLEERALFQVGILQQAALHSGHPDPVIQDLEVSVLDDKFHETQGTT